MTIRTRNCRAHDCPRRVNDRVLFCNVHWTQLPPKLQSPIDRNQEAPAGGSIDDHRRILGGVTSAVAYLAKREAKQTSLAEAQAAAASSPATGTTSQVDTSGSSAIITSGATGAGRSRTGTNFQ